MTSKERAKLRSHAHHLDAILNIGKEGATPEIISSIDEALEARELIKIGVLKTCENEPRDAAEIIAGRSKSEVVQVIGRKITLYRKNDKNRYEM